MKIYKLAHSSEKAITPVLKFSRLELVSVEVCPHCQQDIHEKSTYIDEENYVYHRGCQDKGPIEKIAITTGDLNTLFANYRREHPIEKISLGGAMSRSVSQRKGITEANVDQKQLDMGIRVEHEHTSSTRIATQIALDHLAEIPDYYDRLAKMEAEAKKENS